jgi:hypothetical protein
MPEENTSELLIEKGKAGYAALYMYTAEDQRSLREVKTAARELGRKLYIWTCGKGLFEDGKQPDSKGKVIPLGDTETDTSVLMKLSTIPQKSIVVLRQFHHALDNPMNQSLLLDLIPEFKVSQRMIIIQSPVLRLPPELEKEFAVIETPLPGERELNEVLDGIINTSGLKADMRPSDDRRKELIEAAKGLTTQEAENAFTLSIVRPRRKGQSGPALWDPNIVLDEKCQALRKTGILEYIAVDSSGMANVGGLINLKDWVTPLQRAFTPEARAFGLKHPKGLLMVGPPGAGKSLCAKAISSVLHKPLLKLDMGRIYGSLVGQSEANVRMAIRVAEAVAPCILWLDEIEKGVAGAMGAMDSGTSARVLGTLLTWMQEKTSPVFVYATANDVTALPPELLRKGRFDEMFSVDLPSKSERKEILEIHLRLRNRSQLIGKSSPNLIDTDYFSDDTSEGFTGAEIEAAIEAAMRKAFHDGKELNAVDLQEAFDSTQPLAKTMTERLTALRNWCAARTRPANAGKVVLGTGNPIGPSARAVDVTQKN